MRFAVVNEASDPAITSEFLHRAADALSRQASTDFATLWETTPSDVMVFDSLASIPTIQDQPFSILHIVNAIPEAPGALAYHTIDLGRPVLRLGWETVKANGGTLKDLSSAMSHEILETIADPYCSFYAAWPDGQKFVCLEVCDPVEGDTYGIDGVTVSNFVGPRWFDIESEGPFDFMDVLHAPLTLSPGGYIAFADGSQIYGERVTLEKRAHKMQFSRRASSAKATA